MTTATYRAGIIGLGFMGGGDQVSGDRIGQRVADLDGNHREALANNQRIELVAGCDLDPGRRERFAQRTGANTYDNFSRMLEQEQLDLLSIATSTPGHADLTLAAIQAGVRVVYCEKPIAVSLVEAERMNSACQAAGALLVINHNRRFHATFRKLRKCILDGGLGKLTGITLRWGAGRLGCTGTHMFDAVRMLTGRNFTAVSATLDLSEKPDCRGPEFHDPGGWGVLQMDGGLHVVVNNANHGVGPTVFHIEGTLGTAAIVRGGIELSWQDGRRECWSRAENQGSSMDLAVREIVSWLDTGEEFSCTADDAVHALEAVIGFHAAHARNAAWTPLPLTGADREIQVISG